MGKFYVLLVEDEECQRASLVTLLRQNDQEVSGQGVGLEVREAADQADAEAALREAPEYGYDLILLDLKYPKDKADESLDFRGVKWLPALRAAQPDSAIVVMTAWGHHDFLEHAVAALRDGRADEFIPKETPWPEKLARIKKALENARSRRSERQAARPMRSQVSRPAADDIVLAMQRVRNQLLNTAKDLDSRDSSKLVQAPAEIRNAVRVLDEELTSIAGKLAGPRFADAKQVDCGRLAKDLGSCFELQLRARRGGVDALLDERGHLCALSYEEDLTVALKEVLQNAVFAALSEESVPPRVQVNVERSGEYVKLIVTDSGPGFPPASLDHLFEQDNSQWTDAGPSQHAGMGLYIARRMMYAIGGDIIAENAEGHARVTLLVRDWSKP